MGMGICIWRSALGVLLFGFASIYTAFGFACIYTAFGFADFNTLSQGRDLSVTSGTVLGSRLKTGGPKSGQQPVSRV